MIGTQVDELDIKIYPETTDLVGTTPFLEAAWQGQFDGALLQLERPLWAVGDMAMATPAPGR